MRIILYNIHRSSVVNNWSAGCNAKAVRSVDPDDQDWDDDLPDDDDYIGEIPEGVPVVDDVPDPDDFEFDPDDDDIDDEDEF